MKLMKSQRDIYRYINDQTLRLANKGLTRDEIAANFALPYGLAKSWAGRGYYGSVSNNVKATYVYYLGWFDGNPATLNELPPVEAAKNMSITWAEPARSLKKPGLIMPGKLPLGGAGSE